MDQASCRRLIFLYKCEIYRIDRRKGARDNKRRCRCDEFNMARYIASQFC